MTSRRFAPGYDALETRVQPSAAAPHVYPMDFDGPLPTGAIRGDLAGLPGPGEPGGAHRASPMIVAGMTFNDSPPPVIGGSITATLTQQAPYTVEIVSTSWTVTVSYGGFTTAPTSIAGSTTDAIYNASVPGTYTFTAVTTYMSYDPMDPPPAPTTTTGSVNIAPPDTAVKGGAINTPTNLNVAVQIVDKLYAGGQPVGSMIAAMVQENIPAMNWTGGTPSAGSGGWIPQSPSYQFTLMQGAINDQQMLTNTTGYSQAFWNSKGNGASVCTWTQQLRIQWTMTDSKLVNHTFTAPLNTLNWTWTKVNATQWQAQ